MASGRFILQPHRLPWNGEGVMAIKEDSEHGSLVDDGEWMRHGPPREDGWLAGWLVDCQMPEWEGGLGGPVVWCAYGGIPRRTMTDHSFIHGGQNERASMLELCSMCRSATRQAAGRLIQEPPPLAFLSGPFYPPTLPVLPVLSVGVLVTSASLKAGPIKLPST